MASVVDVLQPRDPLAVDVLLRPHAAHSLFSGYQVLKGNQYQQWHITPVTKDEGPLLAVVAEAQSIGGVFSLPGGIKAQICLSSLFQNGEDALRNGVRGGCVRHESASECGVRYVGSLLVNACFLIYLSAACSRAHEARYKTQAHLHKSKHRAPPMMMPTNHEPSRAPAAHERMGGGAARSAPPNSEWDPTLESRENASRTPLHATSTTTATTTTTTTTTEELPPGWRIEHRVTPQGRPYPVYWGPDGEKVKSHVAMMRYANDDAVAKEKRTKDKTASVQKTIAKTPKSEKTKEFEKMKRQLKKGEMMLSHMQDHMQQRQQLLTAMTMPSRRPPPPPAAPSRPAMNQEQRHQLLVEISDGIGRSDAIMKAVVKIIRAEMPALDMEGEVEIDLSGLPSKVLWKLRDYMDKAIARSASAKEREKVKRDNAKQEKKEKKKEKAYGSSVGSYQSDDSDDSDDGGDEDEDDIDYDDVDQWRACFL